jgi:hypothetical protein
MFVRYFVHFSLFCTFFAIMYIFRCFIHFLLFGSVWKCFETILEAFGSFTIFADMSSQYQNGVKKRKQSASKCFKMLLNSEKCAKERKNVQNSEKCAK